jgi:hypothetical protein
MPAMSAVAQQQRYHEQQMLIHQVEVQRLHQLAAQEQQQQQQALAMAAPPVLPGPRLPPPKTKGSVSAPANMSPEHFQLLQAIAAATGLKLVVMADEDDAAPAPGADGKQMVIDPDPARTHVLGGSLEEWLALATADEENQAASQPATSASGGSGLPHSHVTTGTVFSNASSLSASALSMPEPDRAPSLFGAPMPQPPGAPAGGIAMAMGGFGQQLTPTATVKDSVMLCLHHRDGPGLFRWLSHMSPDLVEHLRVMKFKTDHAREVEALFSNWSTQRIPLPEQTFGEYYLYAKIALRKELCMKLNGRGRTGTGYSQCLYAGRCKFQHECVCCGERDHGWYNAAACQKKQRIQGALRVLGWDAALPSSALVPPPVTVHDAHLTQHDEVVLLAATLIGPYIG